MRAREFIVEDNESRTEEFHGVHMKLRDDGYEVVASALDDWGREMGSVVFNKGDGNELDPQDLLVIDKFRGQGIAKVMYDYVKSKGYEIHKSYDVTKIADQGKESGEYFWQKNRGEERIWEAFNKPYKGKWEKSEYGDVDLNTKLPDGTNLSIMFNNQQDDEGNEVVQVEFYRNNSQEVTGEGDAQRIFATVLNAIQKYIKKYKPSKLSFSASKATDPTIYYEPDQPQPNPESRAKLYDRLVQRYARAWGYRAFRADNGDLVIYELSRLKQQGVSEGKVKLYTDPSYFGAEVDDTGFDSLAIVDIPANQLVGFEPDAKMNQPKSRANVEKIVAGLKQGAKLPPLLVRKYKNGYQVLDGHHRFWAYKLLGVKSIPSRIVPDENIEEISKQGVVESVNDYLWHGSRYRNEVLVPRQANDTGGKEESNKNAIYATPSAKVAIAMGLTTPGSDTGMFPNDPQMVLFKGGIRKGEMVYLHKVPKDLFIKHNSREWYSKPDVKEITPIEVVTVPVDKWLSLIRTATPKDLELQKKNMKKQGVSESSDNNVISFKVQKGKNKFATTLSVGGDPVGVYQYDANTGRSIAEIYPEFKGKGLGKLLVLHAIYTAANLGLDFQEDESRTSDYDNVLDSLSSNGYIVDDDGYWYVTGQGEQYLQQSLKQDVAEGESNDTAISLSKLGKFHPGADTLAEFVPERASARYALHPDKWESTFYSLTNKDSDKLKYYGPKKISIPPGTLVGDMAIANKFYRAKTPEEQEQYAELYKASLQPYPVDVSEYRMPELLIPKQGVAEARGLAPTKPYDDLMANMGYFMSLNTVKIQQDAVDSTAQQELANMQQQFRKPILNGMSFFDVNRDMKISKNPKVAPILLKYVYDMLGYIEPRIKKYIKPEQQGKYLDRLDQIKNDYRGAVQQVS